jgi:hypothetical protein
MTKNKALATFFFLVAFLGAVAFGFLKPNEPSYQNIGIKEWLGELQFAISHHDLQKRKEVGQAIKVIGVEAAPYIMAELRKNSSAMSRTYRNLITRLPAWFQRLAPPPRDEFKFTIGSNALLTIGPSVKSVLIAELKDDDPSVLSASALTLGHLAHYHGTDIKDSLPGLIACLKHGDIYVRMASVTALGHLGLDAAPAVDGLIPLLKDPQVGRQKGSKVFIRSGTARTLGKIGFQAKDALPALRSILEGKDLYDRGITAVAIWRIDSDVTNTLPVMIEALNLVNDGSKWELLEGLEEMGEGANKAFPDLLNLLKSKGTPNRLSRSTRKRITNLLMKIDPEAATSAGVEPAVTEQQTP